MAITPLDTETENVKPARCNVGDNVGPSGPPAVARLGGLPLRTLSDFISRSAWDAAVTEADGDAAAAANAARLGEDLYAVIGHLDGGHLKSRLVALRRCLHRGRPPAASEWNEEIEAALTPDVARRVHDWRQQLTLRRQFSTAGLAELVVVDRAVETARLLAVASAPEFRHALAQAGPSLDAVLEKLLTVGGAAAHSVRARTLLGLTRYLYRAMTKTSPYSTFTTTTAVQWRRSGDPHEADLCAIDRTDVTCVLELDRLVVDHIMTAVVADASLAPHLSVRVNPSLAESADGSLVILGRRPAENIVHLPDSRTVRELMAAAEGADTVADFRSDVAERTGRPAEARQACDRLIQLGVVEIVPPVCDQSDSPVTDLLDFLCQVPPLDVPTGLIDALRRLRQALSSSVPVGDVATLRAQRSAVAGALVTLADVLSLSWPRPEVLQKVGMHENALRPAPLVLDPAPWGEVVDDLRLVRSWLAVHDRMLPVRLAVSEYVRRRADGRIGFVELHDRLQRDLAAPEGGDSAWFADLRPFLRLSAPAPSDVFEGSGILLLQRLRQAREQSSALALRSEITRDDVTRLVEEFPTWVKVDDPATAYVQPVGDIDADFTVVINTVSGAFGKGVGRWHRLLRQANAVSLPIFGIAGDSPVAELSGTFAASVNLRDPMAMREVDYPFTNSDRPAEERIPLGDLVVHWQREGELVLTASSGQPIRVAHLGMMADPLLPPAARLLVALFGQSYLLHPSLGLFHPPTEPDEVQRLPRLTFGRVVIRRAEISFPIDQVPRRSAGETDAESLLRLAGWARAEGVPRRFFLRVVSPDSDWVQRVFAKSRKPMYIDLASPALRAVFEHTLRDVSGRVVVEEALPDPIGPVPFVFDEPRVIEFALEVKGTADRE